ncbi:transcriptional regulator [uncultured Nostoc sp.]|uniref:HVO_A0114 family putative DNA-binding protein n=1 Tax=uncultured Nostoc sp. TaxID=340711 RepID=UPI0035CB9820
MKVQPLRELIEDMRSVARGEKPAPKDAALPSIESTEALVRLLTPENRNLMKTIREENPQSVAELAKLTHRAESNLLRTLSKFVALGLMELKTVGKRKVPMLIVERLSIEIDPYNMADRVVLY